MNSYKSNRRTEHSNFINRFIDRLQYQGHTVHTNVRQEYWDKKEQRWINGKIDIVAVKEKYVTAYELETKGPQEKSRLKLISFNCDAAYIICHSGKSMRIK